MSKKASTTTIKTNVKEVNNMTDPWLDACAYGKGDVVTVYIPAGVTLDSNTVIKVKLDPRKIEYSRNTGKPHKVHTAWMEPKTK